MSQSCDTASTTHVHAETLPSGYQVIAINEGELIEYCWFAHCSELPGCKTDGRTAQEAVSNLKELIPEFIALLQENGLHVPAPNEHLGHEHWDHMTAYTPRGTTE